MEDPGPQSREAVHDLLLAVPRLRLTQPGPQAHANAWPQVAAELMRWNPRVSRGRGLGSHVPGLSI